MSSKPTTARPSDLELMMYADGELPPGRAAEVGAHLAAAGQDEGASVVGGVRELGEALRTCLELEADRAEEEMPAFAGMWGEIERRIHANGTGAGAAARSAAGAAPAARQQQQQQQQPAARPAPAPEPERAGLWASIRAWLGQHRGHLATGLVSACAVAALMLLLGPRDRGIEQVVRQGTPVTQPIPAALELKSEPPELEDLEVYGGSGTILTIAPDGEGDSAATVIWISNDDEKNREGPL